MTNRTQQEKKRSERILEGNLVLLENLRSITKSSSEMKFRIK